MAKGRAALDLFQDSEAGDAGERDHVAAVAGLGEGGYAAGAADRAQGRPEGAGRGGLVGLDHADDAVAGERRIDHGEVARLEDVERHLGARQEKRRRQRKDRNDRRQIVRALIGAVASLHRVPQANSRDDSWRRPASVASSVGPQASKNCKSCLRAFSSSQLRFLRMISRRSVDGARAVALGIEEKRQVETRLIVGGVGREPRLQRGSVA